MTDYTELVKALREYSGCRKGEIARITSDAAAAIEALQAENAELESCVRTLTEQRDYWMDKAANMEPKRGEWVHGREIGKEWLYDHLVTYFEDWSCSNCGVVFEQESKPKYHYCPNCGAKMEVQE